MIELQEKVLPVRSFSKSVKNGLRPVSIRANSVDPVVGLLYMRVASDEEEENSYPALTSSEIRHNCSCYQARRSSGKLSQTSSKSRNF